MNAISSTHLLSIYPHMTYNKQCTHGLHMPHPDVVTKMIGRGILYYDRSIYGLGEHCPPEGCLCFWRKSYGLRGAGKIEWGGFASDGTVSPNWQTRLEENREAFLATHYKWKLKPYCLSMTCFDRSFH